MTDRKKILYIGPAPVRIGGVAIHIKRLAELMAEDYDVDFIDEGKEKIDGYFHFRSFNLRGYFKKIAGADIVHIHSGPAILRWFHILAAKMIKRRRVIVTIHHDIKREILPGVTKWLVAKCDKLLTVNENTLKVIQMVNNRGCEYSLSGAFLPPNLEEEPALDPELSEYILELRKKEDAVLLVSNAWRFVFNDGVDLYGIDVCIKAVESLVKSGINIYLIYVIASCDDALVSKLKEYDKYISDKNLVNNILLYKKPCAFLRLIEAADIVLRTPNTDGDPLSLKEALYLKTPVIASDVIKRPEGVVEFKNRDSKDLEEKIQEVMANPVIINNSFAEINYKEQYKEIYEQWNN